MTAPFSLLRVAEELDAELTDRILPYWIDASPDRTNGGFFGRIDACGRPVRQADKAAVLNARILWAFAAAARQVESACCLEMADRAHDALARCFWDAEEGGIFWMVDHAGQPMQTKKQIYAQAFALYGLTEYCRISDAAGPLHRAIRLFELIEKHAHDEVNGGYLEAYSRDWKPLGDMRLGTNDRNVPKSMNTNLHVLEAYTNLFRLWPNTRVRVRLEELIDRFLSRILDRERGHLRCYFDEDWTPRSGLVSYGHDIEASWLLVEAAHVLGDSYLRETVEAVAVDIAEVVRREGVGDDYGIPFEANERGVTDSDRHWWVQAEALVGFVRAYQLSGREAFLDAAVGVWSFVQKTLLDRQHGEWHARVSEEGRPYPDDKVGPWKGPYHHVRACLEVVRRAEDMRDGRTTAPKEVSES